MLNVNLSFFNANVWFVSNKLEMYMAVDDCNKRIKIWKKFVNMIIDVIVDEIR